MMGRSNLRIERRLPTTQGRGQDAFFIGLPAPHAASLRMGAAFALLAFARSVRAEILPQ